jgi:hypothetical protein
MYVFTSLGFSVLIVVDPIVDPIDPGAKPADKKKDVDPEAETTFILYCLSLLTRLYTVALFFYGGYLEERVFGHLAWSLYALATGTGFIWVGYKLLITSSSSGIVVESMEKYGDREMFGHAVLWISAAVSFEFGYDSDAWWLAGAFLGLDFLFSVVRRLSKYYSKKADDGGNERRQAGPKYAVLNIPPRYKKNTLRF